MTAASHRPHKLLMLTEGARGLAELGSFMALRGALNFLPRGDGHPVIVLPGFLASDASTRPMRGLLSNLGYDTHGWGLGRNLRIDGEREREMHDVVERIFAASGGRKLSLIGWSLGGVYAREIAKVMPDHVRQVISLGSPITNDRSRTHATRLFEYLNGKNPEPVREGRYRDLASAPPVPTSSILTRADGIVAWQASVQAPGPQTENIVVPASHVGLGVNPAVMVAIADRLAQPEGTWRPFARKGLRRFIFGDVRGA